ncbi:MAG TPA: DNA-directed RNA polymerase subunit omega [Candidatus Pullilachnospira intestinigallinarum]|nr:DNA-directed RNA polymerase subunit omega [Candidatus Pullilachnospira intestinigallinarum]
MIHPSYTELMQVVNSNSEDESTPVCNSRYSIVLAASKRARQIIAGAEPLVSYPSNKPLSIAVDELYKGKVRILSEAEAEEQDKLEAAGDAQTAEEITVSEDSQEENTDAEEASALEEE